MTHQERVEKLLLIIATNSFAGAARLAADNSELGEKLGEFADLLNEVRDDMIREYEGVPND